MNETSPPLTDQLAMIPPVAIVLIVFGFTLVRLLLAKIKDSWARTVSETCDTVNFVLVLAFLLIRPFVAQAFYIPSESMERTLLVGDRLVVEKFSYRFGDPQRGDVIVFEAPPAANDGKEGTDFIKRCVGIPGDKIEFIAPKIVIDGDADEASAAGGQAPNHDFVRERLGLSSSTPVKFFPDHFLIDGKDTIDLKEFAAKLNRPSAKIEVTPGQIVINGKPMDESFTNEDIDYAHDPVTLGPNEYFMMGDNRNHSKDSHEWGPLERRRMVGRARCVFWPPSRLGVIR